MSRKRQRSLEEEEKEEGRGGEEGIVKEKRSKRKQTKAKHITRTSSLSRDVATTGRRT
jgi:hypothetical protein